MGWNGGRGRRKKMSRRMKQQQQHLDQTWLWSSWKPKDSINFVQSTFDSLEPLWARAQKAWKLNLGQFRGEQIFELNCYRWSSCRHRRRLRMPNFFGSWCQKWRLISATGFVQTKKTPPNFFLQKIPELVESRNLTFELRSIIFLSKFSETKQL